MNLKPWTWKLNYRRRYLTLPNPLFRMWGFYMPMPALSLPGGGKAVLAGILGVVGALFIAIYFSIVAATEQTLTWPDAGATYALPSKVGKAHGTGQTLQVNLAANTRLSELTFSNMNLGKPGLENCIEITSATAGDYLYVDTAIWTNVAAPSLVWSTSDIHTLALTATADGHTFGATLDATISDVVVSSSRGAGSFLASSSTVDRIIINLLGTADVGTLTFSDVQCSSGAISLSQLRVGDFTMTDTRIGSGDGINSPDMIINSSVSYNNAVDSIVDEPTNVR
jgi:hypothetical protein